MTRVSVGPNGEQANGESKDAATCANGQYVSFTSEATNIVPNDNNGQRDIFIRHMETGAVEMVTQTVNGVLSNGKSYKSYFFPYCDGIMFATDADNMIPNDTNGVRDLFLREITLKANVSGSTQIANGFADPGDTLTYTLTLRNSGGENAPYTFDGTIPPEVTLLDDAGFTYEPITRNIFGSGVLTPGQTLTRQIVVQIDAELDDPTIIRFESRLLSGSQNIVFRNGTMVNGQNTFLPAISD